MLGKRDLRDYKRMPYVAVGVKHKGTFAFSSERRA